MKNFSCILYVASYNYLRQSISVKLIYQFLYLNVFCSLDALKKTSKMKETRIKMEIVEVLQKALARSMELTLSR